MSSNVVQEGTSVRTGKELVNEVVRLFVDLLVSGGTSLDAIRDSTSIALASAGEVNSTITFTELGSIQRDCMEVMCTWRRDTRFIDRNGEPIRLSQDRGDDSFTTLCQRAKCKNDTSTVLKTLLDFGAVSIDFNDRIVSETPTFLLGRAQAGGRLAVDGVLKQLQGFLRAVHRNVCSVTGEKRSRFERSCTVQVAAELEPIFERLVRDRGQIFIDTVDEWLERNAKRESPSTRYLVLGAGAYFICLSDQAHKKIER